MNRGKYKLGQNDRAAGETDNYQKEHGKNAENIKERYARSRTIIRLIFVNAWLDQQQMNA